MAAPLLIGVDVGTQSARAAVFDLEGRSLAESSRPLALRRRGPEEVDQDPREFLAATLGTIADCVSAPGVAADSVAAVGISGQMAGVLGIAADGSPATPYDSWLDTRCRPDVERIERELGGRLVELTGCPAMVAHAPKILWWKRNRPARYREVAKWVMPSAYLAGALCGLRAADAFIDRTHLHFSGLADAERARWSPELTEALDIELDRLPRILAPTDCVGGLEPGAAAACGLAAGTPVAAGLGDTAAGALGAGIARPGQVLDVAGTASVLGVSTTAFHPDVDARTLVLMRGAVEGQWIALSYLAGGDLLRWLPSALGARTLAELLEEAERASAGDGLVFVPHLGGRILPAAPGARGAWVGLDLAQGRGDLARAVLESVAFEYAGFLARARSLFPQLPAGEVRVIGGGSADRLWNRIKASALDLSYVPLRPRSFGCFGAALVAGAAVGAIDDIGAAAIAGNDELERVEPDPALRDSYAARLPDYRRLVELLVAGAP